MTSHRSDPDHTAVPKDGAQAPAADQRSAAARTAADPATAYAELGRMVLGEQPLGAVLRRIADLAAQIVPGADDVSVTLIEGGRARSVAFTGALAISLDERQYTDGFGPCMDAAMTGQLISIEDTTSSSAYPEFSEQANHEGIHHVLAIGMPTLQETSGALNIYGAGKAGPFDQTARQIASTFAGYAAVAVLNAAIYAGALDQVAQMHRAMASRATIEQAKGIVMQQRGCTADEAFAILKGASSQSSRKLRDVAQTITDNATSGTRTQLVTR